jgi:hypothetical protein
MRIAGKPMRYIMEIILPLAGAQFKECYDEIKNTVELMGDIHDCDVFIPALTSHLKEVREFNRKIENPKERLSTRGIRGIVKQLRERRRLMFGELCKIFVKWEREGFRERLVRSIHVERSKMELVKRPKTA